jgi:hypothetical protein
MIEMVTSSNAASSVHWRQSITAMIALVEQSMTATLEMKVNGRIAE